MYPKLGHTMALNPSCHHVSFIAAKTKFSLQASMNNAEASSTEASSTEASRTEVPKASVV